MLVLFLLLFVRQPLWYFAVEITIFNLVLAWLVRRESCACRQLLQLVAERAGR